VEGVQVGSEDGDVVGIDVGEEDGGVVGMDDGTIVEPVQNRRM